MLKTDVKNRPRVFLKAKEEQEIKQGFPWVFDNEIDSIKFEKETNSIENCTLEDGTIVDVFSKGGIFLGSGILNKKSKICVRILSREKYAVYDYEFFKTKIEQALQIRFMYYQKHDSYRLVFAEADFLPGLICERYCASDGRVYLVVQFLALAVEIFRQEILSALKEVADPFAIYERSDVDVREKEGLELVKGWIGKNGFADGSISLNSLITIKENGVLLCVDLENGQKTGYFLDQKFNRSYVGGFCKGKSVLDTFTHTGAFGLNCVKGGAEKVVCVDISETACKTVEKNIELNSDLGAKKAMSCVCADVFDYLRQLEEQNEKFDVIILDPPAFAKSAKSIDKAYGGYKEINMHAMNLLSNGGILVSCSCSHFMEESMFLDMIMHAARDTSHSVQVLEKRGAGPDHPVLLGYPKSSYLKCVVCRVNSI